MDNVLDFDELFKPRTKRSIRSTEISRRSRILDQSGIMDVCIYTIKETADLKKSLAKGGVAFISENRLWKTGADWFAQAQAMGKRLLVFFGPAEAWDMNGLTFVAELAEIQLFPDPRNPKNGQTKFRVKNLRPINMNRNRLVVESTGVPIKDGDIRPYRLCLTPEDVINIVKMGG